MLGETFEMVGKDYRFISEKVSHKPDQINVFHLEGEHFIKTGYILTNSKFFFNGGRGMLQLTDAGTNDIYFKKFDEHVSI